MVLMWFWSRNSEFGRATETRAMFAAPIPGIFTTARRRGWAARRTPPSRRKENFGLNGSEPHSSARKGEEGLAVAPREDVTRALTDFWPQPVGLSEKSGLLRLT